MPGLVRTLNLKNKLEGDELDLSMMRLTEIPVDEIAAIPKATKIDLSNNELVSLPEGFATLLPHITKLELGSNKIRELPSNFGDLTQLKYLDLYNNQLSDLPLSLSNLKSLRYLDLKGNPLKPELSKAAGNCLNSKECQESARNVLTYLKKLQIQNIKQENFKLKQEREREMAKIRKEEEEMARKKAEKKAAKEKKRLELQKVKETVNHNGNMMQNGKSQKKTVEVKKPKEIKETEKIPPNQWSRLATVNVILFVLSLFAGGLCLVIYAEGDVSASGLKSTWPKVKHNSYLLLNLTKEALTKENIKASANRVWHALQPTVVQVRDALVLGYQLSKNATVNAYLAVKKGELQEYLSEIKPFWNSFVNYCWWSFSVVQDNVQKIDWGGVVSGVRWGTNFVTKQFLILKEELCRNEAMMAVWSDVEPVRSWLWNNSLTIRSTLYNVSTEIQVTYFPLVKEQSIYLFNSIRNFVERLLY